MVPEIITGKSGLGARYPNTRTNPNIRSAQIFTRLRDSSIHSLRPISRAFPSRAPPSPPSLSRSLPPAPLPAAALPSAVPPAPATPYHHPHRGCEAAAGGHGAQPYLSPMSARRSGAAAAGRPARVRRRGGEGRAAGGQDQGSGAARGRTRRLRHAAAHMAGSSILASSCGFAGGGGRIRADPLRGQAPRRGGHSCGPPAPPPVSLSLRPHHRPAPQAPPAAPSPVPSSSTPPASRLQSSPRHGPWSSTPTPRRASHPRLEAEVAEVPTAPPPRGPPAAAAAPSAQVPAAPPAVPGGASRRYTEASIHRLPQSECATADGGAVLTTASSSS